MLRVTAKNGNHAEAGKLVYKQCHLKFRSLDDDDEDDDADDDDDDNDKER